MHRYLSHILFILFFFLSCSDYNDEYVPDIKIIFEPNLEKIDDDTYVLDIDENGWQTLHRLDIYIEADNRPVEYASISWYSNLFWVVGDTLGYITSINEDQGLYVSEDTSYVVEFDGSQVPTSNYRSLTGTDGKTSNMIAPVRIMKGDYMYFTYDAWVTGYMEGREKTIRIYLR